MSRQTPESATAKHNELDAGDPGVFFVWRPTPVLARLGLCSHPMTRRFHRIVVLALVALMLGVFIAPASASDDAESSTDDTTAVATATETDSAADEPAVVVPPAEVEEPQQPWTARFLIPLLVVSALALIVAVIIAYNHSVRHRYKVVT